MDSLIENPGFYHVAIKILENLDFGSLSQCRQVSTCWQEFVDLHMKWWRQTIRKLKSKVRFLKNYPKWRKIFYHFETSQKVKYEDLQCFVRFLQLFLQNTNNSQHKTLFAYANEIQDWDFINLLLRIPYDFEERLNDSNGILHIICQAGKAESLMTVLEIGILDFNVTDAYGNTPLHIACCHGHLDIVKIFVFICILYYPNIYLNLY